MMAILSLLSFQRLWPLPEMMSTGKSEIASWTPLAVQKYTVMQKRKPELPSA